MKLCLLPLLPAAVSVFLFTSPATAQLNVTLSTVVGSDTPFPGGPGNFAVVSVLDPVLDRGTVGFYGIGDREGLFVASGGVISQRLGRSTQVPGTEDEFGPFFSINISLDGESLGFSLPTNAQGIYVAAGGPLAVVADGTVSVPGGTGTFSSFTPPGAASNLSFDDEQVAFVGRDALDQLGIYLASGGSITAIADTSTPVPGGTGTFVSVDSPVVEGGDVAFSGAGPTQRGIYLASQGTLSLVADLSGPVPGLVPSSFDLDDGTVAFAFATVPGIYLATSGGVGLLPGTEGFGSIEAVSLDDGVVAFLASDTSAPEKVIYLAIDGEVHEIFRPSEALGLASEFVTFGREGLSGNQIAFATRESSLLVSPQAIYLATFSLGAPVPALSPWPLAVLMLVMLTVGAVATMRDRSFQPD